MGLWDKMLRRWDERWDERRENIVKNAGTIKPWTRDTCWGGNRVRFSYAFRAQSLACIQTLTCFTTKHRTHHCRSSFLTKTAESHSRISHNSWMIFDIQVSLYTLSLHTKFKIIRRLGCRYSWFGSLFWEQKGISVWLYVKLFENLEKELKIYRETCISTFIIYYPVIVEILGCGFLPCWWEMSCGIDGCSGLVVNKVNVRSWLARNPAPRRIPFSCLSLTVLWGHGQCAFVLQPFSPGK
jgi:hypothetical protein